jgi:hypothetical protein
MRRFAVHQQRHAELFHALEHGVDIADIADAGVRMRGRPGRIELHAMNEAAALGAIDFLDRHALGEVQVSSGSKLESWAAPP